MGPNFRSVAKYDRAGSRTMAFKLNKNDREILRLIAEYRVVTATQLAALLMRPPSSLRNRLRKLEGAELTRTGTRGFGRAPGRPENQISLARPGVDLLRDADILAQDVPIERVIADNAHCHDHHLLTNWFRIHLVQMSRAVAGLAVRFLAPTSPFLAWPSGKWPLVSDRVIVDGNSGDAISFTPDGVFSIKAKEHQKTLLFFLEVDMGTETVASPRRHKGDVRQKIVNYQAYFQSEQYKRYQDVFGCELNGFRLLILTATNARLVRLCRLVREMPPSDFVWLSDRGGMFEHGTSAQIWARGGKDDTGPQSILGRKLARTAPVTSSK